MERTKTEIIAVLINITKVGNYGEGGEYTVKVTSTPAPWPCGCTTPECCCGPVQSVVWTCWNVPCQSSQPRV